MVAHSISECLWRLPASAEFFCGDGRIAAGHFALLQRLYGGEGRLDQVVVFDRLDRELSVDLEAQVCVRDREMAERILTEWDRRLPLLVLTGAFHAQLTAQEGAPMAAHLARELVGLQPLMLDYASGHCWSRGQLHDVSGPMPEAPIKLRLPEASPCDRPLRCDRLARPSRGSVAGAAIISISARTSPGPASSRPIRAARARRRAPGARRRSPPRTSDRAGSCR